MGLFDKIFKKQESATESTVESTEAAAQNEEQPVSAMEEVGTPLAPSVPPTPMAPIAAAGSPAPVESPEPVSSSILQMPSRGRQTADAGDRQVDEAPRQTATVEQMRQDPNYVRVFDQYGQEVFLTKEQWRDEVLPANLQAHWNSPDELYGVLFNAMNDGFFPQIEDAAKHLHEIDENPVRGACIHAIVLQQLGRVEEAEHVLADFVATHGEEGVVLTNLAKLYAARGEVERTDRTLERAVELDPNGENSIGWYLSREMERGGEAARASAMERIAAMPGSWRVRLWMAKTALDGGDNTRALSVYREGLGCFLGPVPTEFLYPMSGDLGMAGALRELIELTEPLFLPEIHGLLVGNNLIKAHVDLAEFDPASEIVDRLFAMKRPDWRETLGFWEQTIARARMSGAPRPEQQGGIEIGMLEMIGPVWRRTGGPLEPVFLGKPETAPVVTLLGGSAELDQPAGDAGMQMADALGRLSRALPLFLAEFLEFHTNAQARTLLPRVSEGGSGFVLRGGEWSDAEALEFAREAELAPRFVVKAHVDARGPQWTLRATVLRGEGGEVVGAASAACPVGQPESAVLDVARQLREVLVGGGLLAETAPSAYQLPEGPLLANYLVRLEQLLAVRSAVTASHGAARIGGEREILEGNLGLSLQSSSPLVRALLAATVVAVSRIRPEVAEEFDDRFEMLLRDRPMGEPLDSITREMILD